MILKNLWYRRTRTLLTMLGIAVGVAAVVAFSAFGEGFATGFDRALSPASADLTVAQKDAITTVTSSVDEAIGDELKGIPGVDAVCGTVIGLVQMPEAPYFVVMGEDPRGAEIQRYRLTEGRIIVARREMLLGKLAAESFHKQVGDTFLVNERSFRIVGIYETGVGLEDGGAVVSLADAQRLFDRRHRVSYFSLRVKDPRRLDGIRQEIEARWSGLTATRSGEPTRQSEAVAIYRSFGWFLGLCAVLVGGLGMMNTTLMSVFERTREIGVLRALGWKRRRVVAMVLGESVLLALAGGVAGIALGLGLTQLTRLSPAVETLLQGAVNPGMLLQAGLVALLLGTVGGIYPAWRAAQLQPLEAMRAESGVAVQWGPGARVLARLPGSGILRSLWRRPTRTFTTAAGVGLGVGFMVALMAVSAGFRVTFTRMASAGQTELVAEQANASDAGFSAIDERLARQLKVQPEVRAVSRLVIGVAAEPGLPFFMLLGLDPQEEYIQHYRLSEGRMVQRPREIMIGRAASASLKKAVGDRIHISGSSYQVVGIYEAGAAWENGGGVLVLEDAQALFNRPRQVSFIGIAVHDPAHAAEAARALEGRFPEIMVSEAGRLPERMQDFATLDAALNAVVGLTAVVGGIVMMNAMLMSVFERTQEIGVLRALGWRRRRVLGMVLVEALALSLLSACVGIGIGWGLGQLFTLEPSYGRFFLVPAYTPGLFGQVLALALVLGAFGGLYPAWRASGLRPVEALRYE